MTRVLDAQASLFDRSRRVERRLSTGAVVQVRLEPLGDDRVRVLEYRRRGRVDGRWRRRPEEEGRVYPFDALGLELPYDEIFA